MRNQKRNLQLAFGITLTLIFTVFATVGCGELTKAGWIKKADKICTDNASDIKDIEAVTPTEQNFSNEYADYLEKIAPKIEDTAKGMSEIGEIKSDSKAEKEKNELVKVWNQEATLYRELTELAKKGDVETFRTKEQNELVPVINQTSSQSKAFGMKSCGQGNTDS